MGPSAIVMCHPPSQDLAEMPLCYRSQNIQTLAANGDHEAFAEGVSLWCLNRRAEDGQTPGHRRAIHPFRANAVTTVDHPE
jgi:hypothetical protein